LPPAKGPKVAAEDDGEAATPPPGHHKPAKKLKGQSGEKVLKNCKINLNQRGLKGGEEKV
jgi:hypothetical protein